MLNDAKTICLNSINKCLPQKAVKEALRNHVFNNDVYLVAVGKAAFSMALAAVEAIKIKRGIVISKYGHIKGDLENIDCYEAGHPILDKNTLKATQKAISLVSNLKESDTVLFLLSGGASSLFESCELDLDQLQDINDQMLRKGLNINQINTIRKKLSEVKGGKFADLCKPANVYSIILSDVLNDQLDIIGSGPTVKDSTDAEDALKIIDGFNLEISEEAFNIIRNSKSGIADNAENVVVGSVRILCENAAIEARNLGYRPILLTDNLDVDCEKARIMFKENIEKYINSNENIALIAGGEITVNVKGNGLGGRNQQLALSLTRDIKGLDNVLFISLGSDGTDGPTDAAGAYVDGRSYQKIIEMNIDYDNTLENNDAYHALERINGLIKTGPTGTNVNDIMLVLIRKQAQ